MDILDIIAITQAAYIAAYNASKEERNAASWTINAARNGATAQAAPPPKAEQGELTSARLDCAR